MANPAKLLVVRDAVVTAINNAAFTDVQAAADWLVNDVDDLQIKVIASDQQSAPEDQVTTEETYVINVIVQQKIDPATPSDSDALCDLVIEILLLFELEKPFANLDGPVVLTERRPYPLCSPTVIMKSGLFYGVALLIFTDSVPFGVSGGGASGVNNQTVTPIGSADYDSSGAVQTYSLTVNAGLLVVTATTLSNTATGSIGLTFNGVPLTLDASDHEDAGSNRTKIHMFSLAVSGGTHDLVITPAGGVTYQAIEFGALNIEGLTDNVADVIQTNNGSVALPVNLTTGSSVPQTSVAQTTVISAFAINADKQPASWVWGAQLATNGQDVRSFVSGELTVLTTGSRALNSKQTIKGQLAQISGLANVNYAGAVVAYR